MDEQLKALQKQWELGSTLVATFKSQAQHGLIVNVVRYDNEYWVIAYFTIAGRWVASADAAGASAEEAFAALARRF